uniref:Methyltransferase type 11 domain-containing protein n=1 Tax=Ditylenchus dipsaci TaxID=166011 RepID=A0A915EBP8_9BILA
MKQNQIANTGTYKKVDIIASGDKLPFATNSQDFVLSSHVIEHFYDPVKTIKEWLRVVKPGGYVFIVVPHKERTFDRERNRTTLAELIHRHEHPTDFVELCKHYKWKVVATQDVDDKLGIGFTVVLQKE